MKVIENYIYLLDGQFLVKIVWKKYKKAMILKIGSDYPPAIVDIDRLSGVTLTEKILLKCGFVSEVVISVFENYNFKISLYYNDGWHFEYEEKIGFGKSKAYLYPANINHLHELQNLYYSLTKTELNYEITN